MQIKQTDVDQLNTFLKEWRESNASFNVYIDDHERLTICLTPQNDPKKFIGVIFFHCLYISGPTSWKNCQLIASAIDIGDGYVGFEIRDDAAGFLLKCGGPVTAGDNQLVIPKD